jgi:hypothetical protein
MTISLNAIENVRHPEERSQSASRRTLGSHYTGQTGARARLRLAFWSLRRIMPRFSGEM